MNNETIAMEVIRDIAMDPGRMLAERQRAIDALTLFRDKAVPALTHIERKTDMNVLKERCRLYIQRIKDGAITSMNL